MAKKQLLTTAMTKATVRVLEKKVLVPPLDW